MSYPSPSKEGFALVKGGSSGVRGDAMKYRSILTRSLYDVTEIVDQSAGQSLQIEKSPWSLNEE